jgi:predicted lipoprotein with Yx(FWY)xxD motif
VTRILISGIVVLLALLSAACGSSGSTTKTAATSSTSPASTATTAAAFTVGTATDAKLGAVLVDAQDRTLYRNTRESGGTIACTGGCVGVWPALSVPAGSAPAAAPGLPGKLATVVRPDGPTQVTYNGQPLYHYSGDTKAGDANGQGVAGIWFVVAPSAQAASQAPAPTQAPTTKAPTATTAYPSY